MEQEFIAIGPLAWGKGSTIEQATRRMRSQVPRIYVRPGYGYAVYEVGPDTEVDGLGCLSYPSKGPAPKIVKEMKRKETK